MPGQHLEVRSQRAALNGGPVAMVRVRGDVDAGTVPVLKAALLHAIDHDQVIHCDLSGVGFLGAAGANALAAVGLLAVERGRRLELCGVRGITYRVLLVAGLDRVLPISGSAAG